ncbi:MAG TPA: PSD1 and planctomycete cytochrome C domain-containing protein [Tepidisphaeraceae bacterium]|nr:PSD1 and planctomycete cytochrome C domain-containing protein [Tepidisphaeraceae bacterium]
MPSRWIYLAIGIWFCAWRPLTASGVERIDFSRDIQPILADKCYHCHGPDANQRKAKLRLDTHEGALADHDGKAAVVPGNLEKSEVARRIASADPDEQMPPPKSRRQLSAQQIDLLKQWIAQGAPWGKHWAFVAPIRPPLPAVKDTSWVRNPIDAFILNRLEAEGLRPSPQASKEKLIRRVTLDLTGLAPTPEEVDAFLADHSPDAYEKVVDRLLASPHYGERMALPWLDAARYADTNGFQGDQTRTSWIWRDWVVKSMNDNLPFDQFTVQQIAGDLLPDATMAQRLASGFNRNHMLNGEGGAIAEESRNTYVIDRVNTTSTVWLGLTLGCCQCHDHKYDPFTQKEYYQLFAYFNNLPESGGVDAGGNAKPVMRISTPEQDSERAALKEKQSQAAAALAAALPKIDAEQAEWEQTIDSATGPEWTVAIPGSATSKNGATMTTLEDGSVLVSGKSPDTDIQEVTFKTPLKNIGGLRLEALPDDSLPHGGPGRSEDTGNFVLTAIDGEAVSIADPEKTQKIIFSGAEATFSQSGFAVASAIARDSKTGWAVMKAPDKKNISATFTLADPIQFVGGSTVHLKFYYEAKKNKRHTMGRFRLSIAGGPFLSPDVAAALNIPGDRRTAGQKQKIREHYRNTVSREYRKLNAAAVNASDTVGSFQTALPQVMVMEEGAKPRETFVHVRGQYDKPGDRVYPGVPAALFPLPADAPPNRLALARWIVSPGNPLTARVTVNRYWQMFFGAGLVKTTEDFGIQGEKPTHPHLLDWLATEFMTPSTEAGARPWDVKAMHRLIVTSATYRQSSHVSPELLDKDPENRLLAHGSRYRLSSFALRDQALQVSGLLVDKIGGTPVKPYQPAGLWEEFSFNKLRYEQDHGEKLYRRSLYTFWRRTVPPPTMFDTPSRQLCTVRQARTNTPLQSLVLLNEMTFVESSRVLAERLMTDPKLTDDGSRLTRAFRLCTSRKPGEHELSVLESSLQRLRQEYRSDPSAAMKLLSVGESPRNEKLNPVELAAYAQACDLILNLDETLTRE